MSGSILTLVPADYIDTDLVLGFVMLSLFVVLICSMVKDVLKEGGNKH